MSAGIIFAGYKLVANLFYIIFFGVLGGMCVLFGLQSFKLFHKLVVLISLVFKFLKDEFTLLGVKLNSSNRWTREWVGQVLLLEVNLAQGLLLLQYEIVPRPTVIDQHPQIGLTICMNNPICKRIIITFMNSKSNSMCSNTYPSAIPAPFCPCIANR